MKPSRNRYPLRKVVDWTYWIGSSTLETLECGHRQRARRDIAGETNAARRRCRACYAAAAKDTP